MCPLRAAPLTSQSLRATGRMVLRTLLASQSGDDRAHGTLRPCNPATSEPVSLDGSDSAATQTGHFDAVWEQGERRRTRPSLLTDADTDDCRSGKFAAVEHQLQVEILYARAPGEPAIFNLPHPPVATDCHDGKQERD